MSGTLKLRGEGLVKRYGGREVVCKIDLDVGPVTGLPLPSQIAIERVRLRY